VCSSDLVYWGNLTGHWVNWSFLEAIARRNPHWTFNMIGEVPEGVPQPVTLPNVVFLGTRPVGELRHYGAHADAGIIHFHTSDVVAAVNPVKAYEYLACGLPIISTPMCELDAFPNTWQVHTPEEFEAAMAQIPQQTTDFQTIEAFLSEATWPERTRAFLAHVQATCLNNPTREV
jgi:glycosyltransferase involved in cell wall biosynthesis